MNIIIARESDGIIFALKVKSVMASVRLQLSIIFNPLAWYINGNSECGCGSTRIFIFEVATMCPPTTALMDLMLKGPPVP